MPELLGLRPQAVDFAGVPQLLHRFIDHTAKFGLKLILRCLNSLRQILFNRLVEILNDLLWQLSRLCG